MVSVYWQGYLAQEETKAVSRYILGLVFGACVLSASVDLWQLIDPYFYHLWKQARMDAYNLNETNSYTSDVYQASLEAAGFYDFYLKTVISMIITGCIPYCIYRSLAKKEFSVLQFFSGCVCCCSFIAFFLTYGYFLNCGPEESAAADTYKEKEGYCVALGLLNMLMFFAFVLTVTLMFSLIRYISATVARNNNGFNRFASFNVPPGTFNQNFQQQFYVHNATSASPINLNNVGVENNNENKNNNAPVFSGSIYDTLYANEEELPHVAEERSHEPPRSDQNARADLEMQNLRNKSQQNEQVAIQ